MATADAGATWKPQASATTNGLYSVTFSADGQRGWAVGSRGTIVATADAGATWKRIAFDYVRYPARWFFAAYSALLAPWGIWFFWRRAKPDASIVASGTADAPIDRETADRLGSAPVARGLARYILNRATKPPLTIAISAPWGRGKSSLMRLLEGDMERRGNRAVWFNAWHHQHEPVLTAALLESVCNQAIPSPVSPRGLLFPARLLWGRMRTRRLASVAVYGMAIAGALHFGWFDAMGRGMAALLSAPLSAPLAAPRMLVDSMLQNCLDAGTWVLKNDAAMKLFSGEFGAFGAKILLAFNEPTGVALNTFFGFGLVGSLGFIGIYWLRAFPERPAVLLASVAKNFKVGDAQEQTAFRQRFREHFRDVAEALAPRRLVIFIDDIDRCDAPKAVEMLEAVNYLAESGPCVIVLGLAEDVVAQQVALHFKDIAAMETPAPAAGDQSQAQRYAERYLEKIINLRVRVPQLDQERLKALLDLEPKPKTWEPMVHERAGGVAPSWMAHCDRVHCAGLCSVTRRCRPRLSCGVAEGPRRERHL